MGVPRASKSCHMMYIRVSSTACMLKRPNVLESTWRWTRSAFSTMSSATIFLATASCTARMSLLTVWGLFAPTALIGVGLLKSTLLRVLFRPNPRNCTVTASAPIATMAGALPTVVCDLNPVAEKRLKASIWFFVLNATPPMMRPPSLIRRCVVS